MPDDIELSVVIPVYNSAEIFPELHRRLTAVLRDHAATYEIIAVVDGCKDNSAQVVASFCQVDPATKLIELSRNFGEQAATTAGLQSARGRMVVVMDDDLEDPPEVIAEFIAKAQEGYDVVYGVMRRRRTSWIRRAGYHLFYRFLNRMTDSTNMPNDAGSFCLMLRPVVDAINRMPETGRYIRGLRAWVGFKQAGLEYDRGQRLSGSSGYSLRGYIKFALEAIFSFSSKPIKFVTFLGTVLALVGIVWGIRLVFGALTGQYSDVQGYASMMVTILFLGGIQLISIGVIGQYISRIYNESKRRPVFLIKQQMNLEDRSETPEREQTDG